jgi:NAD(P)H-hydrate epimerase
MSPGGPPQRLAHRPTDTLTPGDALVAARHLFFYGYAPTLHYPKPSRGELHGRLVTQLRDLDVPFAEDFPAALAAADHVVDGIFGFSFRGPVREPFGAIIAALERTDKPVTAIDAPSGWDVEAGPPPEGPGREFMPQVLVSLTAPKPLVRWFKGRHFVGGRFLGPRVAERFGIDVPPYEGVEQVVEVAVEGKGEKL